MSNPKNICLIRTGKKSDLANKCESDDEDDENGNKVYNDILSLEQISSEGYYYFDCYDNDGELIKQKYCLNKDTLYNKYKSYINTITSTKDEVFAEKNNDIEATNLAYYHIHEYEFKHDLNNVLLIEQNDELVKNYCKTFPEEAKKRLERLKTLIHKGDINDKYKEKYKERLEFLIYSIEKNCSMLQNIIDLTKRNDIKGVKKLLDEGVNINTKSKDEYKSTPLIIASIRGYKELVKLLLDHGADVNIQDEYRNTALIHSSKNERIDILKLLLEYNADTNIKNKYNNSALKLASEDGYFEVVKLLLENGAEIDIQDEDKDTPLIHASMFGYPKIVELLIENGADLNIQNNKGYTALMIATIRKYKEIAKLLLNNEKTDPNIKNNDGETALMIASEHGNTEIVKLLLNNEKTNPNIQNSYNTTALMTAIIFHNDEIVKLLLDHGADINIQSHDGKTALAIAVYNRFVEIVKLILKYSKNVDLNTQDKFGYTALMIAILSIINKSSINKNEEIIKLLLDHGADPTIEGNDGETALKLASDKEYTEIVKLLKDAIEKRKISQKGGMFYNIFH